MVYRIGEREGKYKSMARREGTDKNTEGMKGPRRSWE